MEYIKINRKIKIMFLLHERLNEENTNICLYYTPMLLDKV